MAKDKKTCFIVTPIGDNNSDIRRHIDGIIDQAIIPAIGDKYEITVAHRKYEIGSINDRVVKSVYEADLVIANLTGTNPNVMYELAIRYSFGKPAIVIAEEGTKLPFDVIDENTVFYINDPAGAAELKSKIHEFERGIDCNKTNYGPVHKVIKKIPLFNEVESGKDVSSEKMLEYIINRLNSMEINFKNVSKPGIQIPKYEAEIILDSTEKGIAINPKHVDNLFMSCGINTWAIYDDNQLELKYRMTITGRQHIELLKKIQEFSRDNGIKFSFEIL